MKSKISSIKVVNLLSYLITRVFLRLVPLKLLFIPASIKIANNYVLIDKEDLEQRYLSVDCVREPENLLLYRAIASSGLAEHFLDIGANCGHVSLSVVADYREIILFEPNPELHNILFGMFKGHDHVTIKKCAIVDQDNIGYMNLNVPDSSSGLATLGDFLVKKSKNTSSFRVKANTLANEVSPRHLKNSYIKIDVEGLEEKIIGSISPIIKRYKPIIGFEALSTLLAIKCIRQFKGYSFYFARFNFLENGGALSRSFFGIFKALLFGGSIDVIKINNLNSLKYNNFSQIYAVPNNKTIKFELAIKNYFDTLGSCNLSKLKTWKF
jgi:FkbM family methyltransferase